MNSGPIYIISGDERRIQKKHLASLKSFVKNYWFFEDIDKVYGGGTPRNESKLILNEVNKEIVTLEIKLQEKRI